MLRTTFPPALDPPRASELRLSHVVTAAIFLSCYLTWRPSQDIMFTLSDALFVLAMVQLVYLRRVPLEPFRALTPLWLTGFLMLVGGLLIGSLNCPTPWRWTIVASQYLFAWVVLPMILLGRTHEQNITMIKSFIWGVFAVNLFGAIIYFTYSGTFTEARDLFGMDFLSGGRRLGAFTGDANWNGAVLAMAVPCAVFLRAKKLVGNIISLVWLAVLMMGIMLTASFTAFLSALVSILIFAAIGGFRPGKRILQAAAATAGVGLLGYCRAVQTRGTSFMLLIGSQEDGSNDQGRPRHSAQAQGAAPC